MSICIFIIRQAPRAGSMQRILCSDWLPERARWIDTAHPGLPISLLAEFSFYVFMDLDFISVHKNPKRELGQYPAILTLFLVNNIYIYNCRFLEMDYLVEDIYCYSIFIILLYIIVCICTQVEILLRSCKILQESCKILKIKILIRSCLTVKILKDLSKNLVRC